MSTRAASDLPPLIVLLGPTAVGKTALSLDLCQAFAGEIISADSRQIYRGMDIGTAKATPAEQARAPHHLIDIRDPDETLTLAEYQALAYAAIDAIHGRGHAFPGGRHGPVHPGGGAGAAHSQRAAQSCAPGRVGRLSGHAGAGGALRAPAARSGDGRGHRRAESAPASCAHWRYS
ncbi:MAG: isopentenyl transferase family protein [Caldilineaceae bacterium]